METISKRKSLLKNKNFDLTALGAVVSNVGAVFYNFIVSFWILSLTGNDSFIQGLYLGVTGLAFVLTCPIAGVIVDRFNKAKMLWICDFARGASILLTILFVTIFNSANGIITVLFIGGVIGNIIGAFFAPAGSALIPEIVEQEDLQKANSVAGITTAIQTIIGTSLVGVVYSFVSSMVVILYIVAGLYIISAITEIFIRYNYVKREQQLTLKVALGDMKDTFKYVKNQVAIFVLLLLIIFLNLFYNPIQANFFPYFCVTDVAGCPDFLLHNVFSPEIWQSIFCIALAVASIVTSLILYKVKIKKQFGAVKFGFILNSLAVIAMAVSYYFLVKNSQKINMFLIINTVLCFAIGVSVVFVNVSISYILQTRVEIAKYGKVMALMQLGAQGLTPVMVFVSGIILKSLGSSYLLFILAGGIVLTACLSLFTKSLRDN